MVRFIVQIICICVTFGAPFLGMLMKKQKAMPYVIASLSSYALFLVLELVLINDFITTANWSGLADINPVARIPMILLGICLICNLFLLIVKRSSGMRQRVQNL